jgi:hypothetical protein
MGSDSPFWPGKTTLWFAIRTVNWNRKNKNTFYYIKEPKVNDKLKRITPSEARLKCIGEIRKRWTGWDTNINEILSFIKRLRRFSKWTYLFEETFATTTLTLKSRMFSPENTAISSIKHLIQIYAQDSLFSYINTIRQIIKKINLGWLSNDTLGFLKYMIFEYAFFYFETFAYLFRYHESLFFWVISRCEIRIANHQVIV